MFDSLVWYANFMAVDHDDGYAYEYIIRNLFDPFLFKEMLTCNTFDLKYNLRKHLFGSFDNLLFSKSFGRCVLICWVKYIA